GYLHYVIPVVFCSAGAGTQESAHQHRHGSIQTPVTDDTKGMTNQSGNGDADDFLDSQEIKHVY
ncbi:TPA: hypothetical protein ACH73J_004986, partial [Escherichia coli]